jgi:hypothetical protein
MFIFFPRAGIWVVSVPFNKCPARQQGGQKIQISNAMTTIHTTPPTSKRFKKSLFSFLQFSRAQRSAYFGD